MKKIFFSFLCFSFGWMYASEIPMPKDVEQAVEKFDEQLKKEMKDAFLVNFGQEKSNFRNKLLFNKSPELNYMNKWKNQIYKSKPVTQVVFGFEIPAFKSQIPVLLEKFKIDQGIPDLPEYQELLKYYQVKLEQEAIADLLSEDAVRDYVIDRAVNNIVNSQIVQPSRVGMQMLIHQIINQLNLDQSQKISIEIKLENALNRKFKSR